MRKRPKRWLRAGDLLSVDWFSSRFQPEHRDAKGNRIYKGDILLNQGEHVLYVGPCEIWCLENYAYVISRFGPGFIVRRHLEYALPHESETSEERD